jgi:hypothetical protein
MPVPENVSVPPEPRVIVADVFTPVVIAEKTSDELTALMTPPLIVMVVLSGSTTPNVDVVAFGRIDADRNPPLNCGISDPLFPSAILLVIVDALPAIATCPDVKPDIPLVPAHVSIPAGATQVVPSGSITPNVVFVA